ncbi:MAG: dihydroorotase [Planctomycetes bacterium]|nr:dihydroorotase [Planctomycetota bacterium]
MARILIRGGRVVDPESGRDEVGDLLIEGERIAAIGSGLDSAGAEVIDADGLVVAPGLIDMHVHLREPGDEEEETILSGARAAVAGGLTTIAAFPNTDPAIDNEGMAEFVVRQGKRAGFANVVPVGAVTLGRTGERLAEMAGLARAGAVAFSDADRSIRSAEIMRRGLLYARMFNRPVIAHCEDADLRRDGVINYGKVSLRTGLSGIPDASENIVVSRDISLAEITQGRLHIGQMSTRGAAALVRQAKENRLLVTGEVTPHHFSLTDEACADFNPNFKVKPPLRESKDAEALLSGLRDGTIDAIASGHAPHTLEEKAVEFDLAPFGVVGMETLFPISYTVLVEKHGLPLPLVLEKMTINPARILGLDADRGGLRSGKLADIAVFDLGAEYVVDPARFLSKSRNTCFAGWRVRGRAVHVFVGGRQVLSGGRIREG